MTGLTGITWNHTRGYLPMAATAQRFSELHPDISIRWEKRSLQSFADFPVEKLAENFDLLVIDHPFVGYAAGHKVLLPLDEYIPAEYLNQQASNAVGKSHESYCYGGRQWALAIDAATPVSGWRPDLLRKAKAAVPRTWTELLDLARRGLVAVPALAVDSLMHFYMMCGGLGEDPFQRDEEVVGRRVGSQALIMLRELVTLCGPASLDRNPIATWELLSSGNSAAYCPFAYGYSNYARRRYAAHRIEFGGLLSLNGSAPLRSTLGGAGLAISIHCRQRDAALQYVQFTSSAATQCGVYFDAGGQPGHRQAWLDAETNRIGHDFFRNTLATLDQAFLRPRFDGYLRFQEEGAGVVHEYLRQRGDEGIVIDRLNAILRRARSRSAHGEAP